MVLLAAREGQWWSGQRQHEPGSGFAAASRANRTGQGQPTALRQRRLRPVQAPAPARPEDRPSAVVIRG